jgi:hypothetical protein
MASLSTWHLILPGLPVWLGLLTAWQHQGTHTSSVAAGFRKCVFQGRKVDQQSLWDPIGPWHGVTSVVLHWSVLSRVCSELKGGDRDLSLDDERCVKNVLDSLNQS